MAICLKTASGEELELTLPSRGQVLLTVVREAVVMSGVSTSVIESPLCTCFFILSLTSYLLLLKCLYPISAWRQSIIIEGATDPTAQYAISLG